MEYNFGEIEQKWQGKWNDATAYKVSNVSEKPKYLSLIHISEPTRPY